MSISGIDSQIMVARTTDFSRDTSIQQRRPELTQENITLQTKAAEEMERQTVTTAEEAEQARLHTDDDGGSGGGGGRRRGSGGGEDDEEQAVPPGSMVPAEDHIIDIKI